jgi:hypothetical protein
VAGPPHRKKSFFRQDKPHRFWPSGRRKHRRRDPGLRRSQSIKTLQQWTCCSKNILLHLSLTLPPWSTSTGTGSRILSPYGTGAIATPLAEGRNRRRPESHLPWYHSRTPKKGIWASGTGQSGYVILVLLFGQLVQLEGPSLPPPFSKGPVNFFETVFFIMQEARGGGGALSDMGTPSIDQDIMDSRFSLTRPDWDFNMAKVRGTWRSTTRLHWQVSRGLHDDPQIWPRYVWLSRDQVSCLQPFSLSRVAHGGIPPIYTLWPQQQGS